MSNGEVIRDIRDSEVNTRVDKSDSLPLDAETMVNMLKVAKGASVRGMFAISQYISTLEAVDSHRATNVHKMT
jgi:hypothetical protein